MLFLLFISLLLQGSGKGLSQVSRRVEAKFFFIPYNLSSYMHDMLQYQKVGFCNPTAQQQIVTLGLEGRYFPGRGIKEINESE